MFRLNKLTDYATVLMTLLAEQPDRLRGASDIAEAAQLEAPTVAKLLKLLSRAGLLDSVRGARGGYKLARSPDTITVADIITAIDGPFAMTECGLHHGQCHHESHCQVRGNWRKIGLAIESALRSVTLIDMVAPALGWTPKITVERREPRRLQIDLQVECS
ncbi:MAG: SUF system Fe-S cluster assembly regulator [Lysobacterales bacterium]